MKLGHQRPASILKIWLPQNHRIWFCKPFPSSSPKPCAHKDAQVFKDFTFARNVYVGLTLTRTGVAAAADLYF
jgi:hypothetical protein